MGRLKGDAKDATATTGARTVPPREHGGNCDIKNLSRRSRCYFSVYVPAAGLSMGDLYFSQGDGEITFCGAIEMPAYDYLCATCGDFTVSRPMAEYDLPHPCPGCGKDAARVILTVPAMSLMDGGRRIAIAANGRSSHAPKRAERVHAANCTCCRAGTFGRTQRATDGSTSFPSARPWMISH